MLPPAARLRRRRDFVHTVRAGSRAGRGTLAVHVLPRAHPEPLPLVGFVVGRGVGPAVVRNRVRRRLRHLVRAELAAIEARLPGGQVVVRALPPSAGATHRQLARDFSSAMTKALGSTRVSR